MNNVSSHQNLSKDEQYNSTDGNIANLQETVSYGSTGDNSFVISCKQNVSEHINRNRSESFSITG